MIALFREKNNKGSTDSKVIDQQATAEAALSLMADVLRGGEYYQ